MHGKRTLIVDSKQADISTEYTAVPNSGIAQATEKDLNCDKKSHKDTLFSCFDDNSCSPLCQCKSGRHEPTAEKRIRSEKAPGDGFLRANKN